MRKTTSFLGPFLGAAAVLLPAAVFAQDDPASGPSIFDGDYLTIGAGAIYGPSYEGSDDMVLTPVPVVQGRVGGVAITPRPGGIALDLVPDGDEAKLGFSLGPVASYSGNRKRQIEDPVVRSAGKLKEAIDLGVSGGVTAYRVLHAYDMLTVSADVKWNVNSAYKGMIVTPQVSYLTPLSRGAIAVLGVNAKHVDDDYARYYYGVTPAQSAASGLPAFTAKGGWASMGANLLVGHDLDGNLLNGGFAVFAVASYSRLLNDAKRTPWTSIRGDADQWLFGAGVGYTF